MLYRIAMTDAADIRRAIERVGVRGFARRAGCSVPAVQRLVARGAYPERGPHGPAMRAAVGKVLGEPARAPEAAAPAPDPEPAARLLEVPERFARTARALVGTPALEAELPPMLAVAAALATLAEDCGYRIEGVSLEPSRERRGEDAA